MAWKDISGGLRGKPSSSEIVPESSIRFLGINNGGASGLFCCCSFNCPELQTANILQVLLLNHTPTQKPYFLLFSNEKYKLSIVTVDAFVIERMSVGLIITLKRRIYCTVLV